MTSNVDYALWYAEVMGWSVLPLHTPNDDGSCSCGEAGCRSQGKHPRVRNGVYEASADKQTILDWWRDWPDANIGLAPGADSGVTVIDVDPRNNGTKSIKKLGKPKTDVIARTGGGGRHYFVEYVNGVNHKPANGIDIQSDNRIIVLPPSLHASGHKYEWLTGKKPSKNSNFGALPDWALGDESSGKNSKHSAVSKGNDAFFYQGERNDALASYLGSLRHAGADAPSLYASGRVWNTTHCRPPMTVKEVNQVVRSIMRYDAASKTGAKSAEDFPLNDRGYAMRFAEKHGEDIRYSKSLGWLTWNGRFWNVDDQGGALFRSYDVATMLREEAAAFDEKEGKAYLRAADNCESARGSADLLRVASSLPQLSAAQHKWDDRPWLLNVQNGTINLEDGEVRFTPHQREDFLTKIAPVEYDPEARCPVFRAFLETTFEEDKAVVRYVQKLLGYCLTGIVSEQIFPIFWGTGQNGKSTLTDAVLIPVMGEQYRIEISPETLVERRNGQSAHPTELMDLRGARLAIASESSGRRARLDEEMVKRLTGNAKVKGRYLYKHPEIFDATHKLIMITNNKPRTSASEAIWRRLRLIPFTHKITELERDKQLWPKLHIEAPGILNWLIKGCLLWQREGLEPPDSVLAFTKETREESDVFGKYLDEAVVLDRKERSWGTDLYNSYTLWAAEIGSRPLGKINFSRELQDRLGKKIERKLSNGNVRWRGITAKFMVTK